MELVHWPDCRGGAECRCVESGAIVMRGAVRLIAEKIDLEDVTSSAIAALGYNVRKNIAAVRFRGGAIWHIAAVPVDVFTSWYTAMSLGKFYAENIKGKYQAEKMTGHCPDCGDLGWIGERCGDCGCREYLADPRPGRVEDGASSGI